MPGTDSGTKKTHISMVAGKGGVGKTTCAAAAAVHHALGGETTLIISTDPTPSLSHIFEVEDRQKPARVMDRLYLAELGVEEIKQMWDRKFGREVYEVFSSLVAVGYAEFVDFITSVLPGIGDEFMVDYIKELSQDRKYDHIIWDTAPLGQTLGLLQAPAMLSEHLKPAPRIYSRLKLGGETKKSVLDIIRGWASLSNDDIDFLKYQVKFVIITIPEALAVAQLDGIFDEINKHGLTPDQLVINNVVEDSDGSSFLKARAEQQKGYLELLFARYQGIKIVKLPLFPGEIKGIDRLKELERYLFPVE